MKSTARSIHLFILFYCGSCSFNLLQALREVKLAKESSFKFGTRGDLPTVEFDELYFSCLLKMLDL